MSNYTIAVNWSGKDSLSDSDPEKVISGSDFNTEFTTAQTAINTKADLNGSATESFSATTATAGTNTTQVATTAFVQTELTSSLADVLVDGDLLDEDDMVSDSAVAPASQQSIKAYIDSAIAGITSVNITSGTASHGDTLPVPSGYTLGDCTYLASLKYLDSDVPSGKSQDGIYITVDVSASGVVTCQFANNQGSGPHYGTVNWICLAQ